MSNSSESRFFGWPDDICRVDLPRGTLRTFDCRLVMEMSNFVDGAAKTNFTRILHAAPQIWWAGGPKRWWVRFVCGHHVM